MTEVLFSIKRAFRRFAFVAEAEMTRPGNGARLVARVSELSSVGCYIDTAEAFPVATDLRLRIHYGGSMCQLSGKVIYAHPGWGMGVRFEQMTMEQRSIVDSWLAELARKLG